MTVEVTIVIVTAPAFLGGETAVIEVSELMVKLLAGVDPNNTAVTPVKFAPLMVTGVPPQLEPELGFNPVIIGIGEGGIVIIVVKIALGPPFLIRLVELRGPEEGLKICNVDVPAEFVTIKVTE